MTFDEASLERNKSFLKALQELKNLRPQLYSAADYCEKSYLHSEQKQKVLENLKDYAVHALVDTVDHLGTVAYKLNDLFEQQPLDVSTVEVKITCLNQQLLTVQTYMDKEGLRQQQPLTLIPRYHKNYNLPASVNREVQSSTPHRQIDIRKKHIRVNPRTHPLVELLPPKTVSWNFASESTSPLNRVPHTGMGNHKASGTNSQSFYMFDAEEAATSTPKLTHLHSITRSPTSSAVLHILGVTQKDSMESTKRLSPFRSFNTPNGHAISCPLGRSRSKNVLSGFFFKSKLTK